MLHILDFYADWCKPCNLMDEVMKEVLNSDDVKGLSGLKFERVNIENDAEKTQKYQVMTIPTFVFLKNDTEVARIVGYTAKEKMIKTITDQS